jgi:hypothetical protein
MERYPHKNARNSKSLTGILMLVIVALFLGSTSVLYAGEKLSMNDEAKIEKIAKYYARGTDSALNGMGRQEAIDWISKGYTEDCTFTFYFPDGTMWDQMHGIEDYVDSFVLPVLSAYNFSFHAVSNLLVEEASGNTAKLHTYGIATLIAADQSQDKVITFYTDEVMRVNGVWKSYKRDCQILAFDKFIPDASFTAPVTDPIRFSDDSSAPMTTLENGLAKDAETISALPQTTDLLGNYPNPFNPVTTVSFVLAEREAVKLEICTITGQTVTTLVDEIREAGKYQVSWNGAAMPTGVYLCRFQAGAVQKVQRLLLVK